MTSIKALIVDDEMHACINLAGFIKNLSPRFEITAMVNNTKAAEQILTQEKIDVLFLDIEMPHENGLKFLEKIQPVNFSVIFVTAYNQYAIQAIKLNACDYILKPIDEDDLLLCLQKIEKQFEQPNPGNFKLLIRSSNNEAKFIEPEQIICLTANKAYSKVYFIENGKVQQYTLSKNLTYFEEHLSSKKFLRIHKSYLINKTHITNISAEGLQTCITMFNQIRTYVSLRKKKEVLQELKYDEGN